MPNKPSLGFFARFDSRIDGAPIVVLVQNTPSTNRKTGPMIQTTIVREDVPPHVAQLNGEDSSVCGDCVLRPKEANASGGPRCYVITAHGPRAQWNAFRAGRYEEYDPFWVDIRLPVRIGTYGDPTAVPLSFWQQIVRRSRGWTGYTHQWRRRINQHYKSLLMASIDPGRNALAQYKRARKMGWRTFRVRRPNEPLFASEFICPATPESIDSPTTCFQCRACDGIARGEKKANPVVIVHGSGNRKRAAA